MARELRLGFAMGGGVSLGTFSGAALSEAIKLALLYGVDDQGAPYERVVIDVFSGASAGAMALAAMLRTLVHRTSEQEEEAERRLEGEFKVDLAKYSPERQRDLVAAQVVQDVQERLWVREISLRRLLGDGPNGRRDLRYEAGILDRGAVEEIARDALDFPNGVDLRGRRLLADRVLFACSLANVSPILLDATRDLKTAEEAGYLGFADGLTSRVHRELRVFDLYFYGIDEDDPLGGTEHPARWCRYHDGPESEGRIGNLKERRTWAKLAATAVASGAFPFAFSPVVLNRHAYEFGPVWPKALREAELEKHPFTYVDGGMFNNEPIREAFRLASFIDAANPGDFDRRILFVDPNVRPLEDDFRVPVHRAFFLLDPGALGSLEGVRLHRRPTLDRLVPHAGSLLAAIVNEAQAIEEDKVYQARDRFKLRDQARDLLNGALHENPTPAELLALRDFCAAVLSEQTERAMIPAGSTTIEGELRRVIAEEPVSLGELAGRESEIAALKADSQIKHADLWLQALCFVLLDLVMDLEGKSERSRLIAIAPIIGVADALVGLETSERQAMLQEKLREQLQALPGGALHGFAGFCSPRAGRYEVRLGRYCAFEFLKACRVLDPMAPPPRRPRFTDQDAFRREVKAEVKELARRVEAMVEQTKLIRIKLLPDSIVLDFIANWLRKKVESLAEERPRTISYEFRIEVPDKRFELDGKGLGDRDLGPIRVTEGGPLQLITFAEYDPAAGQWSGVHVTDGDKPHIRVDRDGLGPAFDRLYCSFELPDADALARADLMPNPVFIAKLQEGDESKMVEPDRWTLDSGVQPLEDLIFPDVLKGELATDSPVEPVAAGGG